MANTPISVLLVEDNPADTRLVYELLAEKPMGCFDLVTVGRLSAAVTRLRDQHFDVLLLDLSLPDAQGMDTLAEIQAIAPDVPIVVLTGLDDEQVALNAVNAGAQDYLVKGKGDSELLTRALRYAIERKRSEKHLAYLAQYDPLTNLPNRTLFQDRLDQAIKHAQRNGGRIGLMFLDLDHFKDINDTLGHEAGDKLLIAAAQRINTCVRNMDTVARLGGDEFTVILPNIKDSRDVTKVACKIKQALAGAFAIDGMEIFVSTSIGIALFPETGENRESLIKNADLALYAAKEKGRSTYQIYESKMRTEVAKRTTMITRLRKALERDEFILEYQPQFDLRNHTLLGMEALLRWNSPDLGIVQPNRFVPLLEETGLIAPVGEWVLFTSCAQNRRWIEAGFKPMSMAVNLSPRQFRQRNLVDTISAILEDTRLPPELLHLEITESALVLDSEHNLTILRGFKALGIKLSLDDFGTGFSSLNYLRLFPFDTLKVDRSFVQSLTVDINSAAIVGAVIELAHRLHLQVIAEGVELQNEAAFLNEQGCDQVQGFLFGTPMTVSHCHSWLNSEPEPRVPTLLKQQNPSI